MDKAKPLSAQLLATRNNECNIKIPQLCPMKKIT